MTKPSEQIAQAESRLAEIEMLTQTLDQVERELTAYRDTLVKKLAVLQQPPARGSGSGVREPAARPTAPGDSRPVKREATPGLPPGPGDSRQVQRPAAPATPTRTGDSRQAQRPTPPSGTVQRPATPDAAARGGDSRSVPRPATPAKGGSRAVQRPATPVPPPDSEADDSEMAERRSSPRRKGNPVPLQISSAAVVGEPTQGWVVDRSAGGLRILTDQSYAPGSVLSVRPTKAHANFPWIKVKVKSCRPERSSWSLGCQFLQKPAWGEMQMFG